MLVQRRRRGADDGGTELGVSVAYDARLLRQTRQTAELYGLLQAQQVGDRFPLGLPPGTPVAHKTGDRRHWAHDAGIIHAYR